jgi:hypothetical protein
MEIRLSPPTSSKHNKTAAWAIHFRGGINRKQTNKQEYSVKKYIKVIVAVGFTAAIAATTAFSQPTNIITVDEFGVGTINGAPLPSGLLTDPFSLITTLAYTLPFAGVRGDVVLDEPPVPASQHSDVLRFDGNFHLFFFSDFSAGSTIDPPDSPADVGLPPQFLPPTLFFLESGSEGGLQGLFGYMPGFSDPGADTSTSPIPNLYNFISDVPEPGVLPLMACGLGILGFVQRRRRLARG